MQADTQPDLQTPLIAGRYRLNKVAGRGGMGTVWEADDLKLERKVAVKLLASHLAAKPDVRRRFQAEARSAARLSHPNVVSVYDTGEHGGVPFMVMELLSSRTLADEIGRGPMDPHRVAQWSLEALAGLQAAHTAGIIHRDIKPGNILFAHGRPTAKVGDFGIAKGAEGLDMTETGTLLGTPCYVAPERVAGHPATAESDLYSLGVVMYEALAGGKAFRGESVLELANRIRNEEPEPLLSRRPDLPAALANVVEKAMAKDSARRFHSAAEMAGALGSAIAPATAAGIDDATVVISPEAGRHTQVLAAGAYPAPPPPVRRWGAGRIAAGIAAVFVILLILLVAAVILNAPRRPKAEPSPSPSPTFRDQAPRRQAPAPAVTTPAPAQPPAAGDAPAQPPPPPAETQPAQQPPEEQSPAGGPPGPEGVPPGLQ